MTKRTLVCALTGHRVLPPDFDVPALRERLRSFIEGGCESFLCGMAQGFDLTALECLVSLKREKDIYIEACVPYLGQERHFPPEERQKYLRLIAACDRKTVLFDGYRNGCFLARDRYMVDCSDFVLAYLTKRQGGTAYTVKYAAQKGVTVIFV